MSEAWREHLKRWATHLHETAWTHTAYGSPTLLDEAPQKIAVVEAMAQCATEKEAEEVARKFLPEEYHDVAWAIMEGTMKVPEPEQERGGPGFDP